MEHGVSFTIYDDMLLDQIYNPDQVTHIFSMEVSKYYLTTSKGKLAVVISLSFGIERYKIYDVMEFLKEKSNFIISSRNNQSPMQYKRDQNNTV